MESMEPIEAQLAMLGDRLAELLRRLPGVGPTNGKGWRSGRDCPSRFFRGLEAGDRQPFDFGGLDAGPHLWGFADGDVSGQRGEAQGCVITFAAGRERRCEGTG